MARKTGEWVGIKRMLSDLGERFQKNIEDATNKNGRLIEKTLGEHFDNQDLGSVFGADQILYRKENWTKGSVTVTRNQDEDGDGLAGIAAVHEYGTDDGRVPAQPFVDQTVDEVGDQIVKNYEKAIKDTFK